MHVTNPNDPPVLTPAPAPIEPEPVPLKMETPDHMRLRVVTLEADNIRLQGEVMRGELAVQQQKEREKFAEMEATFQELGVKYGVNWVTDKISKDGTIVRAAPAGQSHAALAPQLHALRNGK